MAKNGQKTPPEKPCIISTPKFAKKVKRLSLFLSNFHVNLRLNFKRPLRQP